MRLRISLLALVVSLLVPALASASTDAPLAKKGNCTPSVSTTKGAFKRAQHGWDSKVPITRPPKMNRVRLQSRCVPAGKPAKFVDRQIKVARKQYKKAMAAPTWPTPESLGVDPAYLASIRSCESGGNYSTDTGNGFYGAYQFTLSTWASVGGSGNPALASPEEQDYRAALLMNASGSGNWPVCG